MIIFAEKIITDMYLHQSEGWPHFTWDSDKIDSQLAVVNKAAGFLEGRLSAIGFDVQQRAAVEALTHDIVASSEIEGVILNSDQVRSSVARRMGVQITNETEPSHYIEGVVEMMLDATSGFKKPMTEDRLFGWHNCLFPTGRSGMSVIDVAKYRSAGMKVVSGMFGREKVHYEAPEADQVPGEMKAFLNWFNGADTRADYIKSAIAHLWFVCIHPFDDGNGRIGRAIADMALAQADGSPLRFFSMSRQINRDKKAYYDVLERTSKGTCDITTWIDWYLSCMLRAIKGAEEMLSSILDKAVFWQNYSQADINDRQKKVLNIYLDGYTGKLTAKNWAKHADVSPDTAVRDVQHLTEIGVLVPQEGRVRNIAYGIRISENKTLLPGPKEGEE